MPSHGLLDHPFSGLLEYVVPQVKLLAKRIQAAFASEAFVAKMRSEMAALQHDEAFYVWLRANLAPEREVQARRLGAAFQVQPLAPSFRGAPKALAPRAGASVRGGVLRVSVRRGFRSLRRTYATALTPRSSELLHWCRYGRPPVLKTLEKALCHARYEVHVFSSFL